MTFVLTSTFATLPRTSRGVPMVLGGDPKGKNFLYTNGSIVVIRNIENPAENDIYSEHNQPTTVAKYSPSGFYIASADSFGKVRIWDTTQKEHILKNEFQPFSGSIKDLAWSGDSQKIVVGGEGRERFGHVFSFDTGTSVGEIMGQSKSLNSVDFRRDRPMRIVTASEDNTVAFFHGPPFKFQFTNQDHTRFVNSVRFSPNGEFYASGGADGKCFLYDGKNGEKIREIGSPAHKMGIYGVCFSPDSNQLMTVSGEKNAKVWNVQSGSLVQEYILGKELEDMQVGCLWQGDHLLTVSLSGHINYLDPNNPSTPKRIIKGHNKPITALCLHNNASHAFTASSDGNICYWDLKTGDCDQLPGKGHSSQVQDIQVTGTHVISCAMDNMLYFSDLKDIKTSAYQTSVKLNSQPRRMTCDSKGIVYVACINELVVLKDLKIFSIQKINYEAQCVAVGNNQSQLAVGGADNKVHIYKLSGDKIFEEEKTLEQGGPITDVSFSPDGNYLASADSFRKIHLYQMPDYKTVIGTEWGYHTAKINSLSWSHDSKHLISGALDTNVICWNPKSKTDYYVLKGAHPMSQVVKVACLEGNDFLSVGQDGSIKKWKINF